MEREFELNTKHPACLIWAAELPMALACRVVVQPLEDANRVLQHLAVVYQELWRKDHRPSAIWGLPRAGSVFLGLLRMALIAPAGPQYRFNATLAAISFK